MWFFCIVLLAVAILLGARIWRIHLAIKELNAALQSSKPVLLAKREGYLRFHGIDKLIRNFNDILEQKQRLSETGKGYLEQIQATLGNLREAVVIVDADQYIQLANTSFRELVSAVGDPAGKRLEYFMQSEGFHEYMIKLRRNGESGRQEMEVQIQHKRRWLEISGAALPKNSRTNGNYTLFVFHDITRQKGLEKMRTEFVANASHELRTPVTIIKGFADTLLEDEAHLSAEERRRFLEKISNNAERLTRLLKELLYLSRLEATDSILQRERTSLAQIVKEQADNWKSALREGESLHYKFSEQPDSVFIDPLHFSQVVVNLLENIRKHARNFSRIELETRVEQDGVRLLVRDDGCGIPDKDLPHVFQRFYRVEKGRSRESGGTGLGLSIVKHIVQEHGGEITARSKVGVGTEIDIMIPFPERLTQKAILSAFRQEHKAESEAGEGTLRAEREK